MRQHAKSLVFETIDLLKLKYFDILILIKSWRAIKSVESEFPFHSARGFYVPKELFILQLLKIKKCFHKGGSVNLTHFFTASSLSKGKKSLSNQRGHDAVNNGTCEYAK